MTDYRSARQGRSDTVQGFQAIKNTIGKLRSDFCVCPDRFGFFWVFSIKRSRNGEMLVFLIRSYIFSTLNSSQEKWKWFWLPWFLSGVTTSWSWGSQFKMLENDWQLIVVHSYHNLSFLSVIFNIFGSNYETFFMTSGMFKCMSCIYQANIWGPSIRFAGVSMIRRRNDATLRMQMIKSWWAMTAKIYSVLLSLFGYLTVNWSLLGLHESALFLKASVDFNRLYACTRFHMATLRDSLAQICGIPETQQPPSPPQHCPKTVLWLCHSALPVKQLKGWKQCVLWETCQCEWCARVSGCCPLCSLFDRLPPILWAETLSISSHYSVTWNEGAKNPRHLLRLLNESNFLPESTRRAYTSIVTLNYVTLIQINKGCCHQDSRTAASDM